MADFTRGNGLDYFLLQAADNGNFWDNITAAADSNESGTKFIHNIGGGQSTTAAAVTHTVWNQSNSQTIYGNSLAAAGSTFRLQSTDAGDTQNVQIVYTTADGSLYREQITLTGAVTVASTVIGHHLLSAYINAGGNAPAGNVTIEDAGGNIYGAIVAGQKSIRQCVFQAPLGYDSYLIRHTVDGYDPATGNNANGVAGANLIRWPGNNTPLEGGQYLENLNTGRSNIDNILERLQPRDIYAGQFTQGNATVHIVQGRAQILLIKQ